MKTQSSDITLYGEGIDLGYGKHAALKIGNGGMAIRISLAPLASAVANEGGLGVIAGSGLSVEEARKHIREGKSLLKPDCKGLIGFNAMVRLNDFLPLVKMAVKEKVDFIMAGAGFSKDALRLCQKAKIPYIPIVSQVKGARIAKKLGATAIVLEGAEAGGHKGTKDPTKKIFPAVREAVKIPIIVAGGITTGSDIYYFLSRGANGVQIGTRFAVADESSAADEWKDEVIKVTKADIVIITTPAGMPFAAIDDEDIIDNFVEQVGDGKTFKELSQEFETETCDRCLDTCQRDKHCILHALERAQQGDVITGAVTVGDRVGTVRKRRSVKDTIKMLETGFEKAKQKTL